MKICNLSSGSDGNLTYVESKSAKILIDIGLNCKETEKRLSLLKVNPAEIDAILITHEHNDHIKGLEVFANKYQTQVYVHEDGYISLLNKLSRNLHITAYNDLDFEIKDLTISSTALPHDVKRCSGYTIREDDKIFSIFTDLGEATETAIKRLFGSSLVFLEANHDEKMLMQNPKYPAYLKSRILGNRGHLSNTACAEVIIQLVKNGCKQIVLSHLSRENNTPEFAFDFIKNYLAKNNIIEGINIKIDVADIVPKAIYVL